MNIPDGILCSKTHEYVLNRDEYVYVGITDVLCEKLGDVIFVEFPEIDSIYSKKEVFATVEADGAAAELYMPIAGKIIEINPELTENYDVLNQEPLSQGWLIKVKPLNFQSDIYDLSDYNEYKEELNQTDK